MFTKEYIHKCMDIDTYGDYQLCGVRIVDDLVRMCPKQGFTHEDKVHDIPTIIAAVSKEFIFDVFYDMLDVLDEEVIVILESMHYGQKQYTSEMDLVVLKSVLVDFEDLLVGDGFLGFNVYSFNGDEPVEIQIDFHGYLIGFGNCMDKFDQIFELYGLVCDENLVLVSDGHHIHVSNEEFYNQFLKLVDRIGAVEV